MTVFSTFYVTDNFASCLAEISPKNRDSFSKTFLVKMKHLNEMNAAEVKT